MDIPVYLVAGFLDGGKTILSAVEKVSLADELLAKMQEEHEHHHHDHGPDCTCGCHDHDHDHGHHHADEVFTSWGQETPKRFSTAEVEMILHELDSGEYGQILRAKGIVNGDAGWLEFDYVPGEHEVRPGKPDYTGRLCVIGAELNQRKLKQLFDL